MELIDAVHNAKQILDEERASPTVRYSLRLERMVAVVGETVATFAALGENQLLQSIRSRRPRTIEEDQQKWAFESVNYNLLCALLSRLPEGSRQELLSWVLTNLSRPPGCSKSRERTEPSWDGLVSEFPLIVELCLRNGAKDSFFRTLEGLELFAGHAVLLRELEDMIALNFTVLGDQDYEDLSEAITSVGYAARKQLQALLSSGARGADAARQVSFWKEIIEASDGIKEECRKARYLYLKGTLLEGLNLEVNQDKAAVESYLKTQGFSNGLIECLNRADQIYQTASSGFEFKSCMGHLRSFMEKLQLEGIANLGLAFAAPPGREWGNGLIRLQQKDSSRRQRKGTRRRCLNF